MRAWSFFAFLSWSASISMAARAQALPENHSKALATSSSSENFVDAGSACVPDPKSGQMGGPHFEACFRLCHVTTQIEELSSSQMRRRVLVPAQYLQQELLSQVLAAHSKSRDPKVIEASVKSGLAAKARAYVDFERSSEAEIGKLKSELAKLSADIFDKERKMKESGLYPSRHYYPGIHPVDPYAFGELKGLHSKSSRTLRELEHRRKSNARSQQALYDLLKGLDPSLEKTKTLEDAVLSVKLKSLGESKASPQSPSSYFIQVGPTAMSLTPLPNGELDRIDLREPGGETYKLACDAQGTNAVSSLEKPYEAMCTASSALESLLRSTPTVSFDDKNWKKMKKEAQASVDAGLTVSEVDLAGLEESALSSVLYEEWDRHSEKVRTGARERQRLAFIKMMEVDKVIPPRVQKIFDSWDPESRAEWGPSGWPTEGAIYSASSFAADALEEEARESFITDLKDRFSAPDQITPAMRASFDRQYAERQESWSERTAKENRANEQVYSNKVKFLEAMQAGEETRSVPKEVFYADRNNVFTYMLDNDRVREGARYRLRADANGRQQLEIVPAEIINTHDCGSGLICKPVSNMPLARFEVSQDEARALKEWIGDEIEDAMVYRGSSDDFPLKGSRLVEFCRSLGVSPQMMQKELNRENLEKALMEIVLQSSEDATEADVARHERLTEELERLDFQ